MIFQWELVTLEDQVWLISQAVIAGILLIMPFYLFLQSAKFRAVQSQRDFFKGLGIFVLFNFVSQLLWTIDRWLMELTRSTDSPLFSLDIPFMGQPTLFIAVMFVLFLWSFVPVCWPVEKYVRNSKRFPATKINLIAAIALTTYLITVVFFMQPLIKGSETWIILTIIMDFIAGVGFLGAGLFIVLIIGFYVVLGVKGSGFVRKKSTFIWLGFLLVFVGLALTQVRGGWLSLFSPITMILGFIFLVSGYQMEIK